MYLPLLSTSRENKPTVSHGMHSTSVPLARMYGGALDDSDMLNLTNTKKNAKKVEWQPVAYKDLVVYVRRLVS